MKDLAGLRFPFFGSRARGISAAHGAPESAPLQISGCRDAWVGAAITRRAVQAIFLAAVVFLFVGAGPSTDARFKNLGHRMMCTCGCGQVLLECNHVGCTSSDRMRNELQAAIDKGDNDDLILQGFVQEYGPTVVAAPTSVGFNKVAWIMPFVVLAAGVGLVTWVVMAWKSRPAPALADGIAVPKSDELQEYRARARKETDL